MSIADIINGTRRSRQRFAGQRRQEERSARPGGVPGADDRAAEEPGSVQGDGSEPVPRPARAVRHGVRHPGDAGARSARCRTSMRSSQVLDGATMVGREVLVAERRQSRCSAEGVGEGAIDVPTGATSLQVNIRDANGAARAAHDAADDQRACRNSRGTASPTTARAPPPASTRSKRSPTSAGKSGSLEMLMAGRVNSVTIDAAAPDSH